MADPAPLNEGDTIPLREGDCDGDEALAEMIVEAEATGALNDPVRRRLRV